MSKANSIPHYFAVICLIEGKGNTHSVQSLERHRKKKKVPRARLRHLGVLNTEKIMATEVNRYPNPIHLNLKVKSNIEEPSKALG